MKTIYKILFLTLLLHTAGLSQIEVLGIVKPTDVSSCDGKINIGFEESELPYELEYTSTSGQSGSYTIISTVFSLPDLCPGNITIHAVDNHGCDDTEIVELNNCENVEGIVRQFWTCNSLDNSGVKLGLEPQLNFQYNQSYEDFSFTWNNGKTTKNLNNINPGIYSVEYIENTTGCKGEINNINVFYPFVESYSYPSSEEACDGSLTIKAPEYGNDYYRLEVYNKNDELVFTENNWIGGVEEISNLCDFGKYKIMVWDATEWCPYIFYFSFNDEDCNVGITIENIKGSVKCISNPNDPNKKECNEKCNTGFVEFGILGDLTFPDQYIFQLYKNNELVDEGIGKTQFDDLFSGVYSIKVIDKDNSLCVSERNFEIPICEILQEDCTLISNLDNDMEHSIEKLPIKNGNDGKIVITFNSDNSLQSFSILSALLPNKTEITDFIINNNIVTFDKLHFTGVYTITINTGCRIITEKIEIEYCPYLLNFYGKRKYKYFKPKKREHNKLSNKYYELVEQAFYGNGPCSVVDEGCDPTISHYENHDFCDAIFFNYIPDDEDNPCEGGVLEAYRYKEVNGYKKIVRDMSIIVSEPALYSFDWTNNKNDFSFDGGLRNAYSYEVAYQGYFYNETPYTGDICKDGTYCFFESHKIFKGIYTNGLILLSTCRQFSDIRDIYYYSTDGQALTPTCYDGIQNGDETGLDCGGPICDECPPPGPCNNVYCPAGYECVEGNCIKTCSDDYPFSCPDGEHCEDGYCVPDDPDTGCSSFADCPIDYDCVDNICVKICSEDEDCPDGEHCEDGHCVPNANNNCEPACINGDECIDGECMHWVCDYYTYYNEPNGNPFILTKYLYNDLPAGQRIHIKDYLRGIGLSVKFSQNGESLWEVSCSENPCGYDNYPDCNSNDERYFELKYDNTPVLLEVKPNELVSGNSCYGLNTTFELGLECTNGQKQDLTSLNFKNNTIKRYISLYPNPFKSTFIILSEADKIKQVTVFNTIEQLITNNSFDLSILTTKIDLSKQPNGIYYVKILLDNGDIVVRKMIKAY